MKEIQPIKEENKEEKQEKPKSLVEQINELKDFKEKVMKGEIKTKKLKIPKKAKVKGRKLKKGYIGILRIDENKNITTEKQRIYGNSYKDENGLYHATDGSEILFWMGKFPVIIQPSWKNNPMNLNPKDDTNETYGQPYIKAKMLADTIKVKSKGGGSIIIWILIVGAALFGINYLMGGKIF
jgi:hypothetical protein